MNSDEDLQLPTEFESPFNEILLLSKHTDIVRHLVRIDSKRCCSAGDDGLVIIWDIETGSPLHILRGHSRPITCLCRAPRAVNDQTTESFLLSASSDRLVCLWNVLTGILVKTFTDQNSTTKCIVPLPSDAGLFCFVGEKLCLWDLDRDLQDMVNVDTPDDVQFLLVLKDNVLVAAADTHIVFYKYSSSGENRLKFLKCFESHRESIRALVKLDDSRFASGSLDGAVLQWSVESLAVTHTYNIVEDYQGSFRTYPFSIQHLLPLDQKYLLCAQGCGLVIYDTRIYYEIFHQEDLHDGKVLHLELISEGYLLATCSDDSSIKLWRCAISDETSKESYSRENLFKFSACLDYYEKGGQNRRKLSLQLVGECQAHSAAVQTCMDIFPVGFLSCGVDHQVILWKNSIVESCKKHRMVRDALFGLGLLDDLSADD